MPGERVRAEATVGGENTTPIPNAIFARFQRGEISVAQYLDERVDEAVAPYQGKLPGERLVWLRGMLREQLEADPVFAEYVRQATRSASQAG